MTQMGADPERHVGVALEEIARRFPDRQALSFFGQTATFSEWNDRVNTLAVQFEQLGIGVGDPVALMIPGIIEVPYVAFALAKIGAITVLTNPMLGPAEIEYQLKDAGAVGLVMIAEFMKQDKAAMLEQIRPNLPELKHVILVGQPREGYHNLHAMLAAPPPAPRASFVKEGLTPDDVFLLLYTGGTTGLPKGVPSNSYQFLYPDAAMRKGLSEEDVMLLVPPFFMTAGFITLCLPLLYGIKLVGMGAFDPRSFLKTVQDEKVTYFFAYPTMMRWILGHPEFANYDVSSVRLMAIGGKPVTTEMVNTIQEKFGCKTITGFGMTESRATANTRLDDPPGIIAGSDGKAFPAIELRIVDDAGRDVAGGEVGEIIIRGRPVFTGYWHKPELNAEVFTADGYFKTGDSGRFINDDGYIRIVGRLKDTIRRGAMTIYPEEVENQLKAHPKIANAGVIGVTSPIAGQRVRAYVQLHPGQTMSAIDVVDHCRETLAAYKLPDEVRFIDSIPLSPVRRVQRWLLRDMAAAETA